MPPRTAAHGAAVAESTPIPSPGSPSFCARRAAYPACVLQYLLKRLLYYPYVANPVTQFVDLMYLANISALIFDDSHSGFYVHGRNQAQHSDTTLRWAGWRKRVMGGCVGWCRNALGLVQNGRSTYLPADVGTWVPTYHIVCSPCIGR